MRQRALVNYDTGFDDPFGSSFILPADAAMIEQADDSLGVTTNVVPLPYPELNILLPDYAVNDVAFGYDSLDIYTLPSTEPEVEPDYSTTAAILNLFGAKS